MIAGLEAYSALGKLRTYHFIADLAGVVGLVLDKFFGFYNLDMRNSFA